MKRHVICIALILGMAGCGGQSGNPSPSTGPGATGVGNPGGGGGSGDEPHRFNVIVLSMNGKDCTATVLKDPLKAKKGHRIRWDIENDLLDGQCNENDVSLVFDTDKEAMADDKDPDNPTKFQNPVPAKNRKIEAKVRRKIDDGLYRYTVYYQGKPASADPQLDISGDCGACTPP